MGIEIILAAIGAAGVIGFFLGRRGEGPKDHQSVIASLALLTRDQRAKILDMPAISSGTLPQTLQAAGAAIPPFPLFTDVEKTALLNEVREYQMAELAKGRLFTQAQMVTSDEIALKPSVLPSTIMAGPRYPVVNIR
jgi:acyl CoA:acetate/3-ketoacid CoA transferase alpha subunit